MINLSFNDNWIFGVVGQTEKTTVTLPHDAMLNEPRSIEFPSGKNAGYLQGNDYIYEKDFLIPSDYKDKDIIFEFEGVYREAEVYINDKKAAFRPYGYTNFYVDATKLINFGQSNKIQVIARNKEQPNSRYYSGAGIYRPVSLFILPKERIVLNGVRITTLDYLKREIQVEVLTTTAGVVKVEIYDDQKLILSESNSSDGRTLFNMKLTSCELWNVYNPKLYKCVVTFNDDECRTTFGIRQVKTSTEKGFILNGERVILLGACVHHDNGIIGARTERQAEERKVKILKQNGYNAIRSAHNPCSKALLDACDKYGMLVMDEYVDMWYIHKLKYDYVKYFDEWWRIDLGDMIAKDYNHPSVIMYSLGNEVSETAQKRGIELVKQMVGYCHSLDSTRPVTCGVNINFNLLSSLGFGVYKDSKAAKSDKVKPKAVGSEFFNNLAGLLGNHVMKIGATLPGCDRVTKGTFAELDVAGYNYGILRYKKDLKKYPNRFIVGSETYCEDAYKFFELAKRNPRLIGDFVWAGMDYLGEVGIGAWLYSDYAPSFDGVGWVSAGSGRIDLVGNSSGEMLYTRVAFGLDTIRMAVIPVTHAGKKHSPSAWKMSNAIESWSWENCDGLKTTVEVYARASSVILLLNGVKIGEKRLPRNDCKVDFDVTYKRGTLVALALDDDDVIFATAQLVTADYDTKLTVIAEENTIFTDGLAYFKLRYTDCMGELKPTIRETISVKVSGGSLLGLGSACPFHPNGYSSNKCDTFYGEALAVVRPNGKGVIKLEADSVYGVARAEVQVNDILD